MRKPANIFLLAIIVGALSAAMIYRHLRTMNMEVEAAKAAGQHPVTDVVVARDTISIGSRVTTDQLKIVTWPAEAQPEGSVHDPQDLVGTIARTTIGKNQPVSKTELIAQGAGGLLPLMIDEGMRAMSVKVDSVTGVSGFITPNSRVDVLVAGTRGEHNEMRSRVILQNIKVMATGTIIEQKDEKPVEVPTVTLLVSPEQAETLTLATRYDAVRLALRNYRDEDMVQTPGMTAAAMFHDSPAGPVVMEADKGSSAGCVPTGPTVEVFLGEKMILQPMFDDKGHGWARAQGGGA